MELHNQQGRPAALTDWVYATIKEAILDLSLPMGTQLHIDELAEKLGTSRTPIREALLRLEKDGLVRTVPRVGFFVTQITKRDLRELFEIRQLLEGYAAKTACTLLTSADLAYLDDVLRVGVDAVQKGDLKRFLQVEIDFHNSVMEHAANHHLATIMESLRDMTYRERILSLQSSRNVQETLKEHQSVLEALHRRDGELAGRLMSEHVGAARDRLVAFLELPEGDGVREGKEKEG